MAPLLVLPPLLRLPIELHYEIVSHLELQDRVRLTLTSRYFTSLIEPTTFKDFLTAETGPWAISKDYYACKGCKRFRHLLQFADDMRKGKRARHGVDAQARFCVQCGVDQHWYSPGTNFTIMGKPHVICRLCGAFTDRLGVEGACASCLPSLRAQKKNTSLDTRDSLYESEDDWAYSTKSYTEGNKHSEEMYGVWPDD